MAFKSRKARFVHMLLKRPEQRVEGDIHFLTLKGKKCSLPKEEVLDLRSQGVVILDVTGHAHACSETSGWLRRQRLQCSGQEPTTTNSAVASANDVIKRLSRSTSGEKPFLAPHHVLAAAKVSNVIARAQLRTHVTQDLSALALPKAPGGAGGGHDVSDMAIDHRRKLSSLLDQLPSDCRRILLDVCGFEKRLQLIEFEMGWPQRSAKVVLRMALEMVAAHWGIDEVAVGPNSANRKAS